MANRRADWCGIFFEYGLSKVFRVKMKFDEEAHEVRNVDEQASVTWRNGIPSVSKSWSRGQINEIDSGQAYGFTEQGEFGEVYNYKFHSSEIKDPLRETVTEHGWGLEGGLVQAVSVLARGPGDHPLGSGLGLGKRRRIDLEPSRGSPRSCLLSHLSGRGRDVRRQ